MKTRTWIHHMKTKIAAPKRTHRRRRRQRTYYGSAYDAVSALANMSSGDVTELRSRFLKAAEDEKLWQLMEQAREMKVARRKLVTAIERRVKAIAKDPRRVR